MTSWPRTVGWLQRAMLAAGVILMVYALMGCASMSPEREWYKSGPPSDRVVWVQVPWNEIPAKCGEAKYANHSVWACVVQVRENSTCYVFSGFPEYQAHYLYTSHGDDLHSHELRHCNGWRH